MYTLRKELYMKSHLDNLLDIYEGVLLDASAIWPTSIGSFGRDLSYLRRAAKERGFSFFAITLPELGKVIDRSLSHSTFLAGEVPIGIPLRKKRLELFQDLYMKVFHDDGTLRSEDCDINAVFLLRQLCYLCKKYRAECPAPRIAESLNEFFLIEARLPPPHVDTFDCDTPTWTERKGHPLRGSQSDRRTGNQDDLFPDGGISGDPLPWDDLRAIARRFTSELGIPDWWNLRPKHGPGVVSDGERGVVKYDFPHWPRKLGLWFPYDWHGSGNLDSESYPSDREPPSRLCCVPKTYKGPRLIAAEPVAHQWMQQGIWWWLRERIPQTLFGLSVKFNDQDVSRKRAVYASLTGELCTIDLSSASDRLSCRLVEYIFQGSEILDGLHACRTRLMSQTISSDHPKVIALRKFATQGSSLTFPIQSMVYTILSVWALRLAEGKAGLIGLRDDVKRVTVFGDDIIAPSIAYETITRVLTECGLKVNDAKSFREGFFRESCGMDAFRGYDITPAYHLESYDGSALSTDSTVEVSNNFFRKGLWHTSQRVLSQLPPQEVSLLPVNAGDRGGLGLLSYVGEDLSHLKKVWNPHLQRHEYLVLGILPKVSKVRGTGQASLTQYFTERPDPELPWSSGQVSSVKVRKALTRVSR